MHHLHPSPAAAIECRSAEKPVEARDSRMGFGELEIATRQRLSTPGDPPGTMKRQQDGTVTFMQASGLAGDNGI